MKRTARSHRRPTSPRGSSPSLLRSARQAELSGPRFGPLAATWMIVVAGLYASLVLGVVEAQAAPASAPVWAELPVGTEFVLTDDDGERLLGYGRVEATQLGLRVSDDREDEVVVMIVTPDGSVGTLEGRIRSGMVILWIDGAPTRLDAWLRERGLALRVERATASDEDERDAAGGDDDDRSRDEDDDDRSRDEDGDQDDDQDDEREDDEREDDEREEDEREDEEQESDDASDEDSDAEADDASDGEDDGEDDDGSDDSADEDDASEGPTDDD